MFQCPICKEVKDDSKREFIEDQLICNRCLIEYSDELGCSTAKGYAAFVQGWTILNQEAMEVSND